MTIPTLMFEGPDFAQSGGAPIPRWKASDSSTWSEVRSNRYRLNTRHYLVAHGLRALFEGERHMPRALARELGGLPEGKVIAAGLFGSFARGAARAGSDIDLFVVVKSLKDREEISRILSDAQPDMTRRYGWPVQAIIFERRRLVQGLMKGQTLLDEAAGDWQHVAELTPRELRKSLAS